LKRWGIDHFELYNKINLLDIPIYIESPEYYHPGAPETKYTRLDPRLVTIGGLRDEKSQYFFKIEDIEEFETGFGKIFWDEIFVNKLPSGLDVNDALSIVKDSCHEVSILWRSLKNSGATNKTTNAEDMWQKAVIEKYDAEPDQFIHVQRDFLLDKGIYWLDSTNQKRVFVGKLLKKVFESFNILESLKSKGYKEIAIIFNEVIKM
jgi:hypothetical protein